MRQDDFPIVLCVREIAEIMHVGINKAYDMTKRSDFPALRDGARIIVPRDAFFRWLNETAISGTNVS